MPLAGTHPNGTPPPRPSHPYDRVVSTVLPQFAFEIFDADGSGALNEEEYMQLCAAVNRASPAFPGNFESALKQFDVNDDGMIDFSEVGYWTGSLVERH